MVRMQPLERTFAEGLDRRRAARGRLGAEPEQVGDGPLEVARLAIDIHAFDQAGTVPGIEFSLLEVGDRLAQLGHGSGPVEGEVQADAAHALALERQRALLVRRQAGRGQRGVDRRLRLPEVAAIHGGDHLAHRVGRACVRLRGSRKAHGQQVQRRPRDTAAGTRGARRLACDGRLATADIHDDTSRVRW